MTLADTTEPASDDPHVWFRGRYASWEEARAASTGYDQPAILEKVRAATLKVVRGEAACERDSVAFDRVEYSTSLLACLLYVASRHGNRLEVIDFGGSLGSSYWQNRKMLAHLSLTRWSVVEQPHFLAVGQAEIAGDILRFEPTVDACLTACAPNVLLLSSVLQYLEDPYRSLADLLAHGVPFVILDRTAFFVDDLADRLTVETVPPEIYEASYPAWFLNLGRFRAAVDASGYTIVEEFDSWERWSVDGQAAQNKCLLLERAPGHGTQ
jgi:putative methyltransferase (TIGR04325 family)